MNVACLLFDDEVGPVGHSDGDVVAHAACDALLSAAGLGDLGSNYGTTDPRWSNAPGAAFLSETATRVRAAGFDIANVAVQLIGDRPKLNSRRAEAELVMVRRSAPRSVLQRPPRTVWVDRSWRRNCGDRNSTVGVKSCLAERLRT